MKTNKLAKICANSNCKKPFDTSNKSKRYCDACTPNERVKVPKQALPEKECDQCQTQFVPRTKVARFCSSQCNIRYHHANQSKKPEKPKLPLCKLCDEPFTAHGKGRHLYCPTCRDKHPTTMPHKSKNPCEQCGEYFTHMRPIARFCSRKCQGLWINKQGLGPRLNDDELLERIVSVIKMHERSLSQEELLQEVGTTHKALKGRAWTMNFLYQAAGRTYERAELGSRFADSVGEVLLEVFTGMEIEPDKDLPGMRGFKDGILRADFYIRELNLIVEADGEQHIDGGHNPEKIDYIRANDRLKDEYAAANGITLIRIPETLDRRLIKARLLQGIRRDRPRFRLLNHSNSLNESGTARRRIIRGITPDRPKNIRGSKGEALTDVYCRGCHERPSYKNKNTYLCAKCWDVSRDLYHTSRALQAEDVLSLKEEIVNFVKNRGRYVWQTEVYLYLRQVSIEDLKKHGIKVATICRELGLFAPEDDRIGREMVQRVKEFVLNYINTHKTLPSLRDVLKQVGIDHTTLWTYLNYDKFVAGLGGSDRAIIRYRFRDAEEFLESASEVVRKAGRSMPMTEIIEKVGISYPSYLEHFKSVRSEDIHDRAGVPRFTRKHSVK